MRGIPYLAPPPPSQLLFFSKEKKWPRDNILLIPPLNAESTLMTTSFFLSGSYGAGGGGWGRLLPCWAYYISFQREENNKNFELLNNLILSAMTFCLLIPTVTHKIMYTVIKFFCLGLSCSGKKGGEFGKIYLI